MIQYTTSEGETFGSLSNSLNFAAAHYSGDIFRKVVLLHFNDALRFESHATITQIFAKSPMSVLFILPSEFEVARRQTTPNFKIWEDIQLLLTSQSIDIPVYFSFESKELIALYKELKDQAAAGSGVAAP